MKRFAALALAAVLASCASKTPEDPRIAEVASEVELRASEFDRYSRFTGPKHEQGEAWTLLRSWYKDTTFEYTHQLYVAVSYEGALPRDYMSAVYPGGKQADFKVLDRETRCTPGPNGVQSCVWTEHLGIFLTDRKLRRMEKRGEPIRVRLNARKGDDIVVETPDYYLTGYRRVLKSAR